MNVERAHDGRHIPASHPVLRAMPPTKVERQVSMSTQLTDRIEAMAVLLARIPDVALTKKQRDLMVTIAQELTRRATA